MKGLVGIMNGITTPGEKRLPFMVQNRPFVSGDRLLSGFRFT